MDDLFIEIEIKELRDKITHHSDLYYKKNQAEISDYDFDQLVKRLQKLEEKYPKYKLDDSPTKQVGSDISGSNKIISHKVRMYSLNNAYSLEAIDNFHNKIKKIDAEFAEREDSLKAEIIQLETLEGLRWC